MEEVECLKCLHVWTEQEIGEDCPKCGADANDTIYLVPEDDEK